MKNINATVGIALLLALLLLLLLSLFLDDDDERVGMIVSWRVGPGYGMH